MECAGLRALPDGSDWICPHCDAAADNDDDDTSISLNENDMLNMKKDSPSLSCPVIQVSQGDNYRDQMSALGKLHVCSAM